MSDDSKKHPKAIPSTVVDLLISDIFRKNGVKEDVVKGKLSDEQKKWIKEMVQDLSGQVDSFVNSNDKNKKE
ncbi:spore coat protein [Rossellomorea vietnamensis]|uniref:Spore coat protein n=1 Tax=Rossellomorea vietnamensis TaxID=218284 RepID=A0A5D4MIE0_9BACI|nr:spore coat protein [Rossellomorea vietnamensis]TYS01600.1 spore coat protein [Rossellomorea vietnamensis]